MLVRTHRTTIALWIVLVGVFVAIFSESWRDERRATASVTGLVVEEHRERRFWRAGRRSWVVVDYRVSGRPFRKSFGAANLPDLHVGDAVVVSYDPGDPLVATIAGSRPGGWVGILSSLAVPTALVLAMRHRWRRPSTSSSDTAPPAPATAPRARAGARSPDGHGQ